MALNVGLNAAQLHDELLAQKVDGARHDATLCPFCRSNDTAGKSHASVPSGDEPSGAAPITNDPTTEGGTHDMTASATETATLSKETHEALLAKAVTDATAATNAALERKTNELAELTTKHDTLNTEATGLRDEVARLNKELDTAQVDLKAARDEAASLKADNAAKDEAARVEKVKTTRVDQVKNLKLFPDEYVTEKAEAWAKLPDEDWTDRVDEWTKAKPATASTANAGADTASAMTGTSGELTKDVDSASEDTKPARRAVLGLS